MTDRGPIAGRRLLVLLLGGAVACAAPVATAPPARMSSSWTGESLHGNPVLLFRPANQGAVLVFVRHLSSETVRAQALGITRTLVAECDPPEDLVVLIEPGMTSLWPGFTARGERDLADARGLREACLAQQASEGEPANEARLQVRTVIDHGGDLRQALLGAADPGGDVVIASFEPNGLPVYRGGVAEDAPVEAAVGLARQAIAALRPLPLSGASEASFSNTQMGELYKVPMFAY